MKSGNSDLSSDGEDVTTFGSDIQNNTDKKDDKNRTMKADKLADLVVDEHDSDSSPKVPVKVLAASLQQFYDAKSSKIKGDAIVRSKPPQIPRKPVVKGFVTKVDICRNKTEGLSREDAEAVAVLDQSIALSERRMNPHESDNLIEEIVIPAVRQGLDLNIRDCGTMEGDVLAQRSHELAKYEIDGLLGATSLSDKSHPPPFIDGDEDDDDDERLATTGMEPPRATSSSSTDSGVPECREPLLVAAVDVGTTYSGYAFSFTRDPDNIRIMKKCKQISSLPSSPTHGAGWACFLFCGSL